MWAQALDPETTDNNTTWFYDRAPDGYKFVLHSIEVSATIPQITTGLSNYSGIYGIYDGHEYTHWNIYPGVESKEILARGELNVYGTLQTHALNGWECKEYTLAIRSRSEDEPFKCCIIVWYYLAKMTDLETKQYAVMQPKGEHYRKSGPSTVESTEDE